MVPSTAPAPSITLPAPSSSTARATSPRPVAPPTTAPVPTSTAAPTIPASASPAAGDANPSDCGGQPTVTVDRQQWQCTFDDEFNSTTLDTSKWAVEQTAGGGYHSGIEYDEDSLRNVSVSRNICLTQALGIGTNEFIPGTTPLPATTSVDWVRVWGVPASGN